MIVYFLHCSWLPEHITLHQFIQHA
jgi:hypothetical protein